jgi:hypothetical protein
MFGMTYRSKNRVGTGSRDQPPAFEAIQATLPVGSVEVEAGIAPFGGKRR